MPIRKFTLTVKDLNPDQMMSRRGEEEVSIDFGEFLEFFFWFYFITRVTCNSQHLFALCCLEKLRDKD